jgi:glycine hydroxymethyltransferase
VLNRNTIPGDDSPFRATGIRLGTPWVTQRGFREPQMDRLAEILADVLFACTPYRYQGGGGKEQWRAKVDYDALIAARQGVERLISDAGVDYPVPDLAAYPKEADAAAEHFYVVPETRELQEGWRTLDIAGPRATDFLDAALSSDVRALGVGGAQPTWVLRPDGNPWTRAIVQRLYADVYHLHVAQGAGAVASWLRALSDGFARFDGDIFARVPGPVTVSVLQEAPDLSVFAAWLPEQAWADGMGYAADKPYFVGCRGARYAGPQGEPLPPFAWQEPADPPLKTTSLHALHKELGAKMVPFAGYDMPVWYTSVSAEHTATRTGAGLFDVSHMGVFDFSGPGAEAFLNAIAANDVAALPVGQAHYSYLLGVDGIPLDDIFIYRLAPDYFLMVVNAANNDKDWAWIKALQRGEVLADPARPWIRMPGRDAVRIRDLRDPALGSERRVDIALQGPQSRDILLSLGGSDADKARVRALPWAGVTRATLGGYDLIVARTGYTGERVAYELFVDPDRAPALFRDLIAAGATPVGLAARDSLRTEAGLPLYGHELAGDLNLNPADAGFGSYVKVWKPFFIGKAAFLAHERERDAVVTRFRLDSKGVRAPHPGDPLVDARGRVVGTVTSCSIDSEGYSLGQAYLKLEYAAEGTPLYVFAGADRLDLKKPLGELSIGDRTVVPAPVTVLSRFPRRK